MKNFKQLNGILMSTVIAFAVVFDSQNASAGSYASEVRLPALHSKGYVYTAQLPAVGAPREGQIIKSVSWNWNVQGWPRDLRVSLCQTPTRCLDISRKRTGSSDQFNRFLASQPFYYELTLSPLGPSPVAGQIGRVTVTW
ncbi:flagellar protein FlhE [Pseudomonas syringae]|uniref:flagellar protein FlhE n=1 Tax=Pseudomonas syringae TaxID=317 RepID=UPI001E2A9617|nr:flagellar protein FlhE [Pseudomonas syringae]